MTHLKKKNRFYNPPPRLSSTIFQSRKCTNFSAYELNVVTSKNYNKTYKNAKINHLFPVITICDEESKSTKIPAFRSNASLTSKSIAKRKLQNMNF